MVPVTLTWPRLKPVRHPPVAEPKPRHEKAPANGKAGLCCRLCVWFAANTPTSTASWLSSFPAEMFYSISAQRPLSRCSDCVSDMPGQAGAGKTLPDGSGSATLLLPRNHLENIPWWGKVFLNKSWLRSPSDCCCADMTAAHTTDKLFQASEADLMYFPPGDSLLHTEADFYSWPSVDIVKYPLLHFFAIQPCMNSGTCCGTSRAVVSEYSGMCRDVLWGNS